MFVRLTPGLILYTLLTLLYFAFVCLSRVCSGWLVHELQEGDVMKSGMVGRVQSSKHSDFKEGQLVSCYGHWATLTLVDPADKKAQVLKLPEPDQLAVKPSAYLGALVTLACTPKPIGEPRLEIRLHAPAS